MLMTKERPRGIRTLRGWAISVLQEAGAIRECEEHAWATDRADPHARDRAFEIAEQDPPSGTSPAEAVSEVRQVLDSIGDPAPSVRRRPLAAGGVRGCAALAAQCRTRRTARCAGSRDGTRGRAARARRSRG